MDRAARQQAQTALISAIRSGDERGLRASIRRLPTDWYLENFEALLQAARAAQMYAIMEVLREEHEAAEVANDEAVGFDEELQADLQAARQAAQRQAGLAVRPPQTGDAHAHMGEATEMEAKRKHAYDPLRKMVANDSDAESGWSTGRSRSSAGSAEGAEAWDDEGSDGGDSAWTEAELHDELDGMLDGVTGEILGESYQRSASNGGGEEEGEGGPPPEPQALQLHELSVAQLKQLIRRLGGDEAVPELVLEKRELVGLATQLLSQATLTHTMTHTMTHAMHTPRTRHAHATHTPRAHLEGAIVDVLTALLLLVLVGARHGLRLAEDGEEHGEQDEDGGEEVG
mgnify:CR=1 FL=1